MSIPTPTGAAVLTAPSAPGRLGRPIPAADLLRYLDELARWRTGRRAKLDRLDAAALQATTPDAFTSDVVLAMALWQSVSDRFEAMARVWDSGRAEASEREELSRLIWGRLDPGSAGVPVSLVEATRLCDAITAALRARLALDPLAAGLAERVAGLRASLERCRSMAEEEARLAQKAPPVPTPASVAALRTRLDSLADAAGRGADVAVAFGGLEGEIAHAERDLIVAAATRRDLARDAERARSLRADLDRRAAALRELAALCAEKIANLPQVALPDPSVVGDPPQGRAALADHLAVLERVAAAMTAAEQAYGALLAERADLRGMLGGYQAMGARNGRGERPDVVAALEQARTVLWSAPCDLVAARALVTRYQRLVRGETE